MQVAIQGSTHILSTIPPIKGSAIDPVRPYCLLLHALTQDALHALMHVTEPSTDAEHQYRQATMPLPRALILHLHVMPCQYCIVSVFSHLLQTRRQMNGVFVLRRCCLSCAMRFRSGAEQTTPSGWGISAAHLCMETGVEPGSMKGAASASDRLSALCMLHRLERVC